jgi:hypothetical protein
VVSLEDGVADGAGAVDAPVEGAAVDDDGVEDEGTVSGAVVAPGVQHGPPIKADDEAKTGRLREEDNAE